jgi:hypothetical protein
VGKTNTPKAEVRSLGKQPDIKWLDKNASKETSKRLVELQFKS